jgi:hypothetical protein
MGPDTLVIRTKRTNPLLLGALVVCTAGFVGVLLLLAWLFDRTPRVLDNEGLTVGRGHRRLWRDLTEAKPIIQLAPRGQVVGARLQLRFTTGVAVVTPSHIENGREVIERIERILGRNLELPR